jgi:hypothetical protein
MTFTKIQIRIACAIAEKASYDHALWFLFDIWERKMKQAEEGCLCDCDCGWRHCPVHQEQDWEPVISHDTTEKKK